MKGKMTVFLVLCFCITLFSACGKSGTKVQAGGDDLYVIQLLLGSNAGDTAQLKRSDDTKVGRYIRDNFGIVFEYNLYSGDLREKESLMLAAGDYGEIQEMERDDMVLNYINSGALIDLTPYLDSMPNFSSRFKNLIPYWRLIGGGPLYKWENFVPRELDTDVEVNDFMVRSDLLEKAGWPQLRSTSDWIAFLEQVIPGSVDINGNPIVGLSTCMAESWGLAGVVPILYEKGEHYLSLSNEGFIYDLTNDKFVDMFQDPQTKETFHFFSLLSRKGLLDPECFTDTMDLTIEKASSGSIAVIDFLAWVVTGINTNLEAAGHPEMSYVRLPVQLDSQVAKNEKRLIRLETTRSFNSWGITKNCKNPEKLLKLIDWACSDEGQIMIYSGLEGDHWTRDANGRRVWTDLFVQARTDAKVNAKEGIGGILTGGLPNFHVLAKDGQPHDLATQIEWIDGQGLNARQKEVFAKLGWDSSLTWYNKNGKLGYTGLAGTVYVDPASNLGAIHTKMTETRLKYSAPLMLAKTDEEFESIWRTAMAEYDRMDHQSVIDEFNNQYQGRLAELRKYQ
jgi:hypothetical protein